jgi:hypothetical protein
MNAASVFDEEGDGHCCGIRSRGSCCRTIYRYEQRGSQAPMIFVTAFYLLMRLGDAVNDGAGPWLAVSAVCTTAACFWSFGKADVPKFTVALQAVLLACFCQLRATSYLLSLHWGVTRQAP